MEFVIDGGKTIICPECYVHIELPEPAKTGQVILCQSCRVRIRVVEENGKLNAIVLPDVNEEEDKTW